MNQEQTKEATENFIRHFPDLWLLKPERSPTFSAWMESLNERKVKRAGGNYSEQKFQKNWSTSRR